MQTRNKTKPTNQQTTSQQNNHPVNQNQEISKSTENHQTNIINETN